MLARLLGLIARLFGGKRRADQSLVSLVILAESPPDLSDDAIVAAVKRALPVSAPEILPGGHMPAPAYAPGAGPCRTLPVAVNRAVFGILVAPFPYTDPAEQAYEGDRPDFVEAFARHRAWLAVDFVAGASDDAYSVIGQIAAELMDDHACLLFVPALGMASLPSPALVEDMRRGVWLQHFHITSLDHTVPMQRNDPALEEARRKALSRWSEFTDAFNRHDGQNFSVKFPFTDADKIEHMWIEVSSIDGDMIRGRLGNQPTVVTNIAEGQDVERRRDELEDWLYMREGSMVGGFSLHALLSEEQP
ncbi:MAG: DUF2314 domain-containing protein [Phycisphaerales bacterium]|nr:DUF2314 domain-containing protein [Phycisphaerales bacterium]